MKTLISLCCEDIIRDTETNSISIHTIIEEVVGEFFPMIVPRFCIFYLNQKEHGDPESQEYRLKLSLNEKELHSFPLTIDFQGKERNRNIIKIGGFAFTDPGLLTMEVLNGDTIISRMELPIIKRGEVKVELK